MDNTPETTIETIQEPKNDTHVKMGLRIVGAIVILGTVFLTGVYTGYANQPAVQKISGIVNKESIAVTNADFNTFWKAWQVVNEKLPGADSVHSEERVYGAIKGMLSSFNDPYTTFFTPKENEVFLTEISGEFSGVGLEIGNKDNILTVVAPLKDTPGDIAGIKAGDKIIKIDSTITNDMSVDKAISMIRGKEGTPVVLTIIREGGTEPKVFNLIRKKITLPTVKTEKRPTEKVFIIHLYNFSAQSPELFRKAMIEYVASGYPNLVLDLRGNPGGYLEAAVSIGGWFIPEGKTILKEIGKLDTHTKVHVSKGSVLFPKNAKLIVLVDQGSASASEILAGALSEQGIGILAGEKTFGKGSVQEVIKLPNNTSMKVTVAKWYTPNGVSISESGLVPKVLIPFKEMKDMDNQLEETVKLFKM